jgi:hypothetical protein
MKMTASRRDLKLHADAISDEGMVLPAFILF